MPEPLHIGLVTTGYPPEIDGFATYVRDLAEALAELGQAVTVLVTGVGPPTVTPDGVTVVRVAPPPRTVRTITLLPQLAWSLQVHRVLRAIHHDTPFDVIEFTNWGALATAHSLRKLAPQAIRVTTSIRQVDLGSGRLERVRTRLLGRIEALTVHRSELVIVPARAHWQALAPSHGARAAAPVVVPFGIAVRPGEPSRRVVAAGEPCRLLFVGRLSRRKGFDVLMAAMPAVVRGSKKQVHLTVIGRDPAPGGVPAWGAAAAKLDADVLRCVTYAGEVPDEKRDAAYDACDVFVAPSRYESFGLMYVEAMAHGVPVVGCRVGGVSEVVADGVTGLLVPPSDPEALAEALVRLTADAPARERMGAAGRRMATQGFDRRLMARRSLAHYRRLKAA